MSLRSSVLRGVRPLVQRYPRAAMAYRHFRDLRDIDRALVQTPFGFLFVGNRVMEAGQFETAETAFVRAALRQADALVNVGANIGYYCCFALQQGCRAIAFEPMAGNLRTLYRNVVANGWADRIEVHPVALGASAGLVEIYGGDTAASLVAGWAGIPREYRETVPMTTLDAALGARLSGRRTLVVVDVEGAELGMLQGAAIMLAHKPRPVWMVEISVDEHQPTGTTLNPRLAATFEIFERAGYAAWSLGDSLSPLPYQTVRLIAHSGVNTLATHNFVFAEPGHAFDATAADARHRDRP